MYQEQSYSNAPYYDDSHLQHHNEPYPQSLTPFPNQGVSDETQSNVRSFNSFTVYGTSAALCFNFTERDGKKTINIDAAPALQGQRKFNWKDKISLLVSESELPHLILVLYGWKVEFEGLYHGPQKNKSFKAANQQGKIFFSLSQPGKLLGVPIGSSDAFYLLAKLMSHIISDYPGVSVNDLSYILQATTLRLSV